MAPRNRTLMVEAPDTQATVDFIDTAVIEIKREGETLLIVVKVSHGEDSSSWDQHEFAVSLR